MDFNGPNIQYETAYIACKQRVPEKELKKTLKVNYQTIAQIFSRDPVLVVIWKDQVQHSAIENTVFFMIFLHNIFST